MVCTQQSKSLQGDLASYDVTRREESWTVIVDISSGVKYRAKQGKDKDFLWKDKDFW